MDHLSQLAEVMHGGAAPALIPFLCPKYLLLLLEVRTRQQPNQADGVIAPPRLNGCLEDGCQGLVAEPVSGYAVLYKLVNECVGLALICGLGQADEKSELCCGRCGLLPGAKEGSHSSDQ